MKCKNCGHELEEAENIDGTIKIIIHEEGNDQGVCNCGCEYPEPVECEQKQ